MRLDDRTALVIGGTGGIGSAICETLRDAGAKVLATAYDASEQAESSERLNGVDVHLLDMHEPAPRAGRVSAG